MTAEPTFESVDNYTADLLDLLADDPGDMFGAADRDLIAEAIHRDALTHGGHVSPNRVRRALAGQVKPQYVGPVYRRLCLDGHLRPDGWEVSDDTAGRNSGKPHRTYLWTEGAIA